MLWEKTLLSQSESEQYIRRSRVSTETYAQHVRNKAGSQQIYPHKPNCFPLFLTYKHLRS